VFSMLLSRGYISSTEQSRKIGESFVECKPSASRYNRVTLFLGDINTATWPSGLGSFESCSVVKYGS
jgi:hypothetical protein